MPMGALNDRDPAPPELYERPHWYACHTRSRAEKRVERMLADAGVEAFLSRRAAPSGVRRSASQACTSFVLTFR